jgi:hypothetical protein
MGVFLKNLKDVSWRYGTICSMEENFFLLGRGGIPEMERR